MRCSWSGDYWFFGFWWCGIDEGGKRKKAWREDLGSD